MNTTVQTKFTKGELGRILSRVTPKLSDAGKTVAFDKFQGVSWIETMIQNHCQEYLESDNFVGTIIPHIVSKVEEEAELNGHKTELFNQ